MIQRAHITTWRSHAPWATDAQVEQDLVICRALVEIYTDPMLSRTLAFRGGTALHKLFLMPASRYSEDIDLVRVDAGPAGEIMSALRNRLDPWLGTPRWKQTEGRITFVYRFNSEIPPITPLKLKVEINTREFFSVLGFEQRHFAVQSPWFTGDAALLTYRLEELLGTKLRALFQRRKGRDLFDLDLALRLVPNLDPALVVECCERYLAHGETPMSRRDFENNLEAKLADKVFVSDVPPLLVANPADVGGAPVFDIGTAHMRVRDIFLQRLR